MSIPGLLDAIRLFDDEELVGTWEDRFCRKSFFSFLLLHPFRYRVGAAYQAGSLSAASRAEMADVEQMKKIIFYSSRLNLPLVRMSASWCLVSMYRIWILGSMLILSNNQSKATLWVLDTCLSVGRLPYIIILITASWSSKTYNMALEPECVTLDGTWPMLIRSRLVFVVGIRFRLCDWGVTDKFPRGSLTSLVLLVWWRMKYFSHPISQRVRAGIPSMRKPASRDMISVSVEQCETEVCFLHIQLIGTNVWISKMHNVPPDVEFESSRSLRKIGVLKQFQSAMFSSVSHITIPIVSTCVMNM